MGGVIKNVTSEHTFVLNGDSLFMVDIKRNIFTQLCGCNLYLKSSGIVLYKKGNT